MSIKFDNFGKYVTVENGEEPVFKSPFRIKISWSCIGSVDIETAKSFRNNLNDAIKFAEEKQTERGGDINE